MITVNGQPRPLPAGGTIADVVRDLSWVAPGHPSPPRGVAVAVNDHVVPRRSWPVTALSDGDRVEVLTAVQGG